MHTQMYGRLTIYTQAKENADDLVAQKKELDAKAAAKRQEAKDFEVAMRKRASTIGNIIAKGVPVSMDEVCCRTSTLSMFAELYRQDNNEVIRTWHPDGPNGQVEKKTGILAHHEVLLRLDAMDLERGTDVSPFN